MYFSQLLFLKMNFSFPSVCNARITVLTNSDHFIVASQNNIPNMLNSSKISINVWPRNWKWAEPELIKLLNIFILCFRPINADNRIRTPPCFFALLTQHSRHQAEDDCANDEGPVPGVRTGHRGNTQEDEDQRLAHAAPHLQEVFDGGVGLVRYVGLHIRPHHHATRY